MSIARGLYLGHPPRFFSRRLSRKESRATKERRFAAFFGRGAGSRTRFTGPPALYNNCYTTPRFYFLFPSVLIHFVQAKILLPANFR